MAEMNCWTCATCNFLRIVLSHRRRFYRWPARVTTQDVTMGTVIPGWMHPYAFISNNL